MVLMVLCDLETHSGVIMSSMDYGVPTLLPFFDRGVLIRLPV